MLFLHAGSEEDQLTNLGCPDCRGVLAVRKETDTGLLVFACTVGHQFSHLSLLPAKEDQVETALWIAVELYEELVLLHREFSALAERRGAHEVAAAYRARADRAQAHAENLRKLIAEDAPAIVEEDRDERAGA
jgi:two-component system chemotaxis response regulator CheB